VGEGLANPAESDNRIGHDASPVWGDFKPPAFNGARIATSLRDDRLRQHRSKAPNIRPVMVPGLKWDQSRQALSAEVRTPVVQN
jgi:hypothetical protein